MSQIRPVQVNNSLRPVLEIKILDSFDWAPNLELAPNSSKRPASNKHPLSRSKQLISAQGG